MKKLGSFLIELIQVVVFAVSIFLFVYLLVLQPHKIKGRSMEPNFHDGEYLLTDKISYRLGEPERGDVIVFRAETGDEFIKRVIGLPGETVRIQDGKVFVNDRELREDYLPDNFITRNGKFAQSGKNITIEEGTYFVLGDNRDNSLDSREIGLIDESVITGRAWIIYWPVNETGVIPSPTYVF